MGFAGRHWEEDFLDDGGGSGAEGSASPIGKGPPMRGDYEPLALGPLDFPSLFSG